MIGGIQRVLIDVANSMSNDHFVTIAYTYKPEEKEIAYKIDKKIELNYIPQIHDGSGKYIKEKVIRKINENIRPIKNINILKYVYYPPKMRRELANYIKAKKFDVVIGVAGKYSSLLAVVKSELSCKCIGWEHNSYDAYFKTKMQNSLWRQDLIFKKFIPKLDACVVLTDSDVRSYQENMGLHMTRIYNPRADMSDNEIVDRTNTILFVGRLEYEQKGLHYLAQIANCYLKRNQGWKFQIVGEGAGKEKIKEELDETVSDRVEFLGEQTEVNQFYKRARIFVSTSKWEGFGLVIVEALSFGLPVVSFKTTGPSEIIGNHMCGRLVDCYDVQQFVDALNELTRNEETLKLMSREAYIRANEFDISKIKSEWNALIGEERDR